MPVPVYYKKNETDDYGCKCGGLLSGCAKWMYCGWLSGCAKWVWFPKKISSPDE